MFKKYYNTYFRKYQELSEHKFIDLCSIYDKNTILVKQQPTKIVLVGYIYHANFLIVFTYSSNAVANARMPVTLIATPCSNAYRQSIKAVLISVRSISSSFLYANTSLQKRDNRTNQHSWWKRTTCFNGWNTPWKKCVKMD